MRDSRDTDPENDFPYARPPVSAWVAAAAVALAFFVLGGFIKTYAKLELLREESRREIADLRAQIDTLKAEAAAARLAQRARPVQPAPATAVVRDRASRVTPLPPAQLRTSQPMSPPLPDLSQQPRRLLIPEIDGDKTGVTYTIGRSSRPPPIADLDVVPAQGAPRNAFTTPSAATAAAKPVRRQVVAVNNNIKRLMMEGGNDIGLDVGARLELTRQGRWIGDLRVLDVFDNLSACEILHATLPPEPGDVIRMP